MLGRTPALFLLMLPALTLGSPMSPGSGGLGERARPAGPRPSLEDSDVVNLHFFLKKTSRGKQLKFGRQLEQDGMKVLFHEFADETAEPLISVELSVGLFKRVFKGKLEYRAEEMSARRGTYYQLYVTRCAVPKKYRPMLEDVMQPDPQMY